MSSAVARLKDLFLLHSAWDFAAIPIGAFSAWLAISATDLSTNDDARIATYTGLVTLAGLSMAAVTFARSTVYGASSDVMAKVRDSFKEPLRANWRSIVRDTFLIAVIGIVCLWIDASSPSLAVYLAACALSLLVARVLRAFAWMEYSQRMEILATRDRMVSDIPYASR